MSIVYNLLSFIKLPKILGIIIPIILFSNLIFAQCPTVQAIMIDACNPESVNEFVIVHSGGGFNVNNISMDYDINNNIFGPENNDLNINAAPCGLTTGNINAYTGCSNLIAVGPGFNVPANSILVIQTSDGSNNGLYNFSSLCGSGQCVYVIASNCVRTAGAFSNVGAGIRTTVFGFGGGCNYSIDYDRSLLVGGEGAYYLPGSNTYGNGGCSVPPSGPAPSPVIPTFNPIPNLCQNQAPPSLQGISNNGIPGTWNPMTINTSTTGTSTYTFTPSAGQCASTAMLSVTVNPVVNPVFSAFGPYCQGETAAPLPGTSNNGITGSWAPFSINTSTAGTTIYTFTPNAGQCANPQTLSVTVEPTVIPVFNGYGPYCEGETAPPLPGNSINGINGNWNPSNINTSTAGTTIYTFTPSAGQCATIQTVSVTVNAPANPLFDNFGPYCQNVLAPPLPGSSNNGISGTWNPATINTTNAGTTNYSFTPNPGQCANNQNIDITVNALATPQFNTFGPYCQNSSPPGLPSSSINGVQGSWSPAFINTSVSGTTAYTFTPDAGQCGDPVTISITINPEITPNFNLITDLCQFDPPITLSSTSNNGISGTWAPATVMTSLAGTQTYNFTPTAGQCATALSISITVTAIVSPIFNPIPNQCQFDIPPGLPGTSLNGVSGTWNPPVINTANTGTFSYTFTPTAPACAQSTSLSATILPYVTPVLPSLGPYCQNDPAVFLPGTVDGISGMWSGVGVTANQFNPSASGAGNIILTFEPFPGQCANINTTSVSVIANPTGNLSGNPQLCKGQCGTVNFNFSGGSGTFNINMNINVAGFFNFNFPMIGVTNNTSLTICYQNNPIPFNPATNTLFVPINTPPGSASLTLLNFTSTPAGNCPTGVVGSPGTISVTLLPEPDANPASITECDIDQDGQAVFNLMGVDNTVKNNVAANSVSWFTDAIATNPVPTPNNFTATNGTIVYAQVSNPQGCTKIAAVNLIVQVPQIPVLSPFTTCENGNNINLPVPVSGINGNWSDPGGYVSGNIFNPTGLAIGDYPITFTPLPGLCAVSAVTTVNIISAGPVPLPAVIASECVGAGLVNLPGSVGGVNGIWSGSPFLSGNVFDISLSGTGSFVLTFTPDASAGCLQSNTTSVIVNPNTDVPPQTLAEICQTASPFVLSSTLAGYNGNWINDVNVFNNLLTVPPFPGSALTLNLTFDPTNVCINNIPAFIQINAPTSINSVTFPSLCLSSDPFLLPNTLEGFSGSWTLAGNNIIQINPTVLGEGNFILNFTPSAGQCANVSTGTISINAFTAGNDFQAEYCNSGVNIVNLNSYLSPGSTTGGTWEYGGNEITTPELFDLNQLIPGTNTLTYMLNDPVCGTDDAVISFTVALPPFAGNDSTLPICQNNLDSVDLNLVFGSPDPGGTWVIPPGLSINLDDLNNVDLSQLSPGAYSFTYNIPDGICPGTSASLNLIIASFSSAGPDITFAACSGSDVNLGDLVGSEFAGGLFENTSMASGILGDVWSTAGNPVGGYLFRYYFDNTLPCAADTANILITLAEILSAGADVNDSFCQSGSINLNNFIDPGASPGGQFFFEGNPLTSGIFNPGSEASYAFEYRVGDGIVCPISISEITLIQNLRPDFTSALTSNNICSGQSTVLNINFPTVTGDVVLFLSARSVQTGTIFLYQTALPSPVQIPIAAATIMPFSFLMLPVDQTFAITLDSFRVLSSGCVFSGTGPNLNITILSNPVSNITRQLCSGQSFTKGNVTFNQNNPSGTVIIPASGPGLCDSLINVTLTFFPPVPPTNINQTTCDDNFSLTVGNITFNKFNPVGTVSLQNINGCDSLVNVTLTFSNFSTGQYNATTCDPSAVYTVGNQQFNILNPAGSVTLVGASAAGCDSVVAVNITYLSAPTGVFNFTTCDQNYFINLGNVRFDAQNSSGIASLTGQATNGCDSLVNVQLTFLSAAGGNLNVTTCNDNYSTTVGSTVFNRQNPSGQVILPNAALNGCDSIVSVQINFLDFEFSVNFEQPCSDENAIITVNSLNTAGPYLLTVNGAMTQNISVLPYNFELPPGNYVIGFTNAELCTESVTIQIEEISVPNTIITQTQLPDGKIQLNIETTAQNLISIMWTPSQKMDCATCFETVVNNPVDGEIIIASITYGNGCIQEVETELRVKNIAKIIIPNIFSPESLNGNNRFFVKLPENVSGIVNVMRVFDRWGNVVFEKSNFPSDVPDDGWDGKFKNTFVLPGVYVYYILIKIDGEETPRNLFGDITVLR